MSEQDDTEALASTAPSAGGPGVLAQRLGYLFDTKRRADGKRFSYREVVAAIETDYGISLSIGYLSKLILGTSTNPTLEALQGLARFFDVEISYFDPARDVTETQQQLKLAEALRAAGVEDVAMRAVGLPPASVDLVISMIDRVRQVEGLPPVGQGPDSTT
jgi:transcriptional regulator with XRE-family HTH domain